MLRMSRLTDYGIVLLAQLAASPEPVPHNARELATATHLPLPVVSKVLKGLARQGLLASHRGAKGGYSLARRPDEISVAEVIAAVEGPIALTECSVGPGHCTQEPLCQVREPWYRINQVIQRALDQFPLSELLAPAADRAPADGPLGRGL